MRKVSYLTSLILVFSVPWENAVTVGQVGTLTRAIGGFTALACMVATMEKGFRKPHFFHAVLFAFVTWNIASFFWSIEQAVTIQRIKTYIQLSILSWIFWELYTERKELYAALQAYIFGGYVVIASTIWNLFYGHIISEYQFGRYAGAGLNAVDQALILALGLPIAWHLATDSESEAHNHIFRFINYAYIPFSAFAIFLTGSRTGIFVCIPAFFYIMWFSAKSRKVSIIFAFLTLICATIFAMHLTPADTAKRLATVNISIASADLGGRIALWKASINIFSNHSLFGIGSGALTAGTKLNTVAHNTFLSVASELGLIGISIFIIILLTVLFQILHQSNSNKALWLTILIVWGVGAATLTWEFRKTTWLFINFIVINANLYGKHSRV